MQPTRAALTRPDKIAPALRRLFKRTGRLPIVHILDSTGIHYGQGWNFSDVQALVDMGIPQYGSGLHGPSEGNGDGANFGTFTLPTGTFASMPAEWQPYLTNRIGEAAYTGAATTWFINADQVGWVAYGLTMHAGGSERYGFAGIAEAIRTRLWYLTTEFDVGTGGAGLDAKTGVSSRRPLGNNQVQYVTISNIANAGGTFTIAIGANVTAAINRTASAAQIKAAIELANAGVTVTVAFPPAVVGTLQFSCLFTAPAATNQAEMVINTAGLTAQHTATGIRVRVGRTQASTLGTINLASEQTINAELQAATGMSMYERTIAADATRDFSIECSWNTSTAQGPFVGMFGAMDSATRSNGFSLSTLIFLGGQGTKAQANSLIGQSQEFLSSYFMALAQHNGYTTPADGPMMIKIGTFVNDRNDATTAIGSASAGNTSAGVRANLTALLDRIEAVFTTAGWSTSQLYFLLTVASFQESDNSSMAFARTATSEFAESRARTCASHLSALVDNFAEATQLASYAGATPDYPHYTQQGHLLYSTAEWTALRASSQSSLRNRTGTGSTRSALRGRGEAV